MANDPLTFLKSYMQAKAALQQDRQFREEQQRLKESAEAQRALSHEQMQGEQQRWAQQHELAKQQLAQQQQQQQLTNQAKVGELLASGAFKPGEAAGDTSASQGIADVLGFGEVPQAATPRVALPGAVPMYGEQLVPVPQLERQKELFAAQGQAKQEAERSEYALRLSEINKNTQLTPDQKQNAVGHLFGAPLEKETIEGMYVDAVKGMEGYDRKSPEQQAEALDKYQRWSKALNEFYKNRSMGMSSFLPQQKYRDLKRIKASAYALVRRATEEANKLAGPKATPAARQNATLQSFKNLLTSDPDLGPVPGDDEGNYIKQSALREALSTVNATRPMNQGSSNDLAAIIAGAFGASPGGN